MIYTTHVYTLHTHTEHLFPAELAFYRFARHIATWLRQLSLTLCTSRNHMACVMNPPVWKFPLSMFFMRLSHSQRAAGQRQQETNSCQAYSPLMHVWFSRRSCARGLRDETGQEVAVICTIKSSCFSSKLRLGNVLGRYPKPEPGFYDGKQPREDTLTAGLAELLMSWLRHRIYGVVELLIALHFSLYEQI